MPDIPALLTLDEFFEGHAASRRLFTVLRRTIEGFGPVELRVTRSQIAFRRRKAFAWAWVPGKYLRGKIARLVLTLVLPVRDASPSWKEIVEPAPGRFTHHLELFSAGDVDGEVRAWLQEVWEKAG